MPLNDGRPSTSTSDDQNSDTESSERCDSMTSSSDTECSRQSFTSGSSSKHSSPASSPPKIVTFDELMTAARDLSNLSLAHEIVVNGNFKVEQPELPENSLERKVKEIVHKAFWDRLEAELNEDPPVYEYAIRLVEEIKEILLSFLNPGANRLRNQICEVLDMDLIQQQVDNDAVDIHGLENYIITVMGKLCAPARDDDVKKLKEISDIVPLFREIFHVLDLMKMDMVNFTINNIRPQLQMQSVEYERTKFQAILDQTPSALDHTTEWMKESLDELMAVKPCTSPSTSNAENHTSGIPSPMSVLNKFYIKLLDWDCQKKVLPETLMTDETRLLELQKSLELYKAVAAVLLIVYNAIGGPISGLPVLADQLKKITSVLLEGIHIKSFNRTEALENVSAQICTELNKSLTERGYPALPAHVQVALTGQICTIVHKDNSISNLIDERVHSYMKLSIVPNSHTQPPANLGGLALIQPELEVIRAQFNSIVNFNKQVYCPFYGKILRKLLLSEAPQGTAEAGTPSVCAE
ncbi:T-complex protein 11-like protein 2 [Acipenser oxyrinchus oxyrinchus]|uniref:T-complex protein 11-like protein 2 n=1 Tax=Acipenser oxyrinchus oxyrinchus TaxID=40147 RepID=A0AAD8G6I4_ACIOX|nr:T-complex protein 11-like protein 2 [Acipenser oxyrinchus oxyrinchus]